MRILRATDHEEWDEVIARLPVEQRDVHFTSAYARVQEAAGGMAVLAVWDTGNEFVAQPFLMQPIPGTGYFDIKNLYGFGGPVLNAARAGFGVALSDWASDVGVVSEYCVLHPLMFATQLPMLRSRFVMFTKPVVVIEDLANFNMDRCEHRVRKSIKKAQRECFRVIEAPDPSSFNWMYRASMDRLKAGVRWRYDLAYWKAHQENAVYARWFFVPGRRGLLTVGGENKIAYAHFLGSSGEGRGKGLDELLYYEAALALAKEGFERLHLGGGLTEHERDPLLFFKSGFSDVRYQVGSYRRVFMPGVYERLSADAPQGDWFPAYRRKEFACG